MKKLILLTALFTTIIIPISAAPFKNSEIAGIAAAVMTTSGIVSSLWKTSMEPKQHYARSNRVVNAIHKVLYHTGTVAIPCIAPLLITGQLLAEHLNRCSNNNILTYGILDRMIASTGIGFAGIASGLLSCIGSYVGHQLAS